MVDINIHIEPASPEKLKELLNHIVKEITDHEYRLATQDHKVDVDLDGDMIITANGKYNWQRSE